MMSHPLRRSAIAVFAIALAGCMTVGRNFPARPVAKIEKGVSTKKDVRLFFGEPFRTGVDNGYESWTYSYNRWISFGAVKSKDLYIVFNKDGTVRAYTFNSNLKESDDVAVEPEPEKGKVGVAEKAEDEKKEAEEEE